MKSQETNNPSVILDGKFAKWYIEQFAIHKDGQKILDSVSLEAKILREENSKLKNEIKVLNEDLEKALDQNIALNELKELKEIIMNIKYKSEFYGEITQTISGNTIYDTKSILEEVEHILSQKINLLPIWRKQ